MLLSRPRAVKARRAVPGGGLTLTAPAGPPIGSPGAPSAAKEPARIQALFGRIAPWYDFLNHVLTLGIDVSWRRRLVRELPVPRGSSVLDVACGTGDLAIALHRAGHRVAGVDFCLPMLRVSRAKADVPVFQSDALQLPVADGSMDAVTVAFGVRNFADLQRGLREMRRVLRPGGVLAVLEFGIPHLPVLRHGYLLYFRCLLPAIGRLVSGDPQAYGYLRDSVLAFPYGTRFAEEVRSAGLEPVSSRPLSGGISYLYLARRPAG